MQSGYGGVSEIQQFMVDSCPPSLFSISPPPPPPNTSAAAADIIHSTNSTSTHHHHHKFHPLLHPHPHPHPPPHPHHNPPSQFAHFHPIPITQQLFQQTHHQHHQQQQQHQFQLFHQQLGLDHESGPENSTSPARMMGGGGGPPFLAAAMNFKLGHLDEGSCGGGGGSRDGLNEDDGILHGGGGGGGGGDDGSESRLHPWHREDDHHSPNIKEPFWRPLDIDYINRSKKRPSKDQQPDQISNTAKFPKKTKEHTASAAAAATADSNYKLFSELEAIYKPGSIAISSSGGGGGNNNNQTGSGSALTVDDDNPILPATAPGPTIDHQPDHASDTSNGGDVPPPTAVKLHKGTSSSSGRRKRAKRKKQQQLSSITAFFETLVKQLMDHQEGLHRKFLEVMERRDQERTFREEAWRKQEAAKSSREAAARAQEQALAAGREAAIVSFIEKITGESLDLPSKPQLPNELQKDQDDIASYDPNCNALEPYIGGNSYNCNYNNNNSDSNISVQMNSSRWPKAEVQALIKVRSGFEVRFQEPGLKGPLWEEVSTTMGAMGYHRSAKRCKEKWENINKYFRKTKDSGKKRPQHSKTCPYFHQLDQLYSKSPNSHPSPAAGANVSEERKDNSELLDAIVVSNDHQSFKFPEMGATRIELSSEEGKKRAVEAGGGKGEGNEVNIEEEDDDDNDNDDGEEEGGERQGQDQGQAQNSEGFAQDQDHHHYHHRRHQRDENAQHDSNLFFHRLRS